MKTREGEVREGREVKKEGQVREGREVKTRERGVGWKRRWGVREWREGKKTEGKRREENGRSRKRDGKKREGDEMSEAGRKGENSEGGGGGGGGGECRLGVVDQCKKHFHWMILKDPRSITQSTTVCVCLTIAFSFEDRAAPQISC